MRPVELLPSNTSADLGAIARGWAAPGLGASKALDRFELAFARFMGGGNAFTFAAGRVALAAILESLDIQKGDEVIVPGYTCVAVPNPVLFCGAIPVYADIDPSTLNISVDSVARVVTPRTRAVVVQHTFGFVAPIEPLVTFCRARGLAVIEDCTHATGATCQAGLVGTYGDASFHSFEQTKMLSAGSGGVAHTSRPELARRLADFQSRCAPASPVAARLMMGYLAYNVLLRHPRWADRLPHAGYYLGRLNLIRGPRTTDDEMRCLKPADFERRWSGAQARVALRQLAALPTNLAQRRRLATVYEQAFANSRIETFKPAPGTSPSYVRFPLRVRDKAALAVEMRRQGVQLGLWFTAPVHPAAVPQSAAGYLAGSCPHAEAAVAEVANLPCHPRMSLDDAHRVAQAVLGSAHA